jgi:glycosyltransferase involved in cell wall biosynthesis
VLPTGLARVARGILEPIVEKGDFQVIQHGWFHLSNATTVVPWKIIPVQRHEQTPAHFKTEDKSGELSFDLLVENLKPDIVFVIADYGRFDHIINSPHRSDFLLVSYLPLDVVPPHPRWAEVVRKVDRVVYYTDIAAKWGEACSSPGESIPHGVDTAVYAPVEDDHRNALRRKFFEIEDPDVLLLGAIGRNQSRKRWDLTIEMLAYLRSGGYSRCLDCDQVTLHGYSLPGGTFEPPEGDQCQHCLKTGVLQPGKAWDKLYVYMHTDPDEPHGDAQPIRRLIATWAMDDYIKLNPAIDLRAGKGLSSEMLSHFMNCFDVFVHPCNGGGWELPPMEAAACGLPLVAADAPAQNEWLATVPSCRLISSEMTFLRDADGYRAQASISDYVRQVLWYLERPDERKAARTANAEWAKNYQWSDISEKWQQVFHDVLDPENKIERWRTLIEV